MGCEHGVVDLAVIGSGFAGSLLARILAGGGYDVRLFERGRHPRFAIGESTTPLANLALERLAKEGVHELGHCFGLVHCDSPGCVMGRSPSARARRG